MIEATYFSSGMLSAAGIAWDISGALALSMALALIPDERLQAQAGSYWGTNPTAFRAYCEQRLDTRFGLLQLLVGFTLQAFAAVGISISASGAAVIAGLIVPAWWIYRHNFPYWALRDSLRLSVTEGAQEHIWRKHFLDVPDLLWSQVLWNEGIIFAKERNSPQ